MPAILDDPAAPTIFRVSGGAPYPDPAHPAVPHTIVPRHVTLRDRQTVATVVPFASRHEVPESLLRYLHDQFNKEIEGGDTYPMLEPMPADKFASYWFQNFGGIMLLGHIESAAEVVEGKDWSKECLGTFYIKPNYPGRSSHICNAGFIVTDAARNRGVGRLMGETYLEWAPKLGYKYSVFNLVYETNVASCKIWDALGFKRIGRVKGAGNLKSYPDRLVDAIIYGRDLGDAGNAAGNEELVSEERFDKIKFYLKYGRYPNGADRAEKSRLRSAATHYKLLDGDVLMLKDKEVISDPQRQYEIARGVHNQAHGGINKTTATIAERYHWSRIKETVSDVIRNCTECKDTGKASSSQSQQPSPGVPVNGLKRPNLSTASSSASKRASPSPSAGMGLMSPGQRPTAADPSHLSPFTVPPHHQFTDPSAISILPPPAHHALPSPTDTAMTDAITQEPAHNPMLQDTSHGPLHSHPASLPSLTSDPHSLPVGVGVGVDVSDYQPIDPQIIAQSSTSDSSAHIHPSLHHHHHHHHHHHFPFCQPSPPQHTHHDHDHDHDHHPHHDPDADAADAETFQALINAAATDDEDDGDDDDQGDDLGVGVGVGVGARRDSGSEPGLGGEIGIAGGDVGPSPPATAHHHHHNHNHHAHHHNPHLNPHHHHPSHDHDHDHDHGRDQTQQDGTHISTAAAATTTTTGITREVARKEPLHIDEEEAAMDRDLEMLLEADQGEDHHGHHQEPACGLSSARRSIDVDMDVPVVGVGDGEDKGGTGG